MILKKNKKIFSTILKRVLTNCKIWVILMSSDINFNLIYCTSSKSILSSLTNQIYNSILFKTKLYLNLEKNLLLIRDKYVQNG